MTSKNVILLDVFSYSCMNCMRSLDYIKQLDQEYKRYGLKTILIHAPEWEFEKNKNNISTAIKKYKIKTPIKIDNDKKIVKRLKVNFWPTQILIKKGNILYKHNGEGNYKKLERHIINVLKIKSKKVFNREPRYTKFPTVYAGKRKGGKIIILKTKLKFGNIYASGNWIQKDEFIQHTRGKGSLTILTKGKTISLVAKAMNKRPAIVGIKLNNKVVKDLKIDSPGLYEVIKLRDNRPKKLTLTTGSNLAVYSFSFQ